MDAVTFASHLYSDHLPGALLLCVWLTHPIIGCLPESICLTDALDRAEYLGDMSYRFVSAL